MPLHRTRKRIQNRDISHKWLLTTAGLIGLLTGCQSMPGADSRLAAQRRQQAPTGLTSTSTDRPAAITAAQEADVQIAFARAAEQQGDLQAAMAGYTKALQRDKKRADACTRLAILHDRLGEFRESDPLYKRALELHPADPDIFCDMGYSYYLQRRWAEAEQCLKQALAIQSDHPRAHNNLALLRVRDGHQDDALAEFRKGGNSPSQAHCNLAFALSLQGKLTEARHEYQLALAAEPGSKIAQEQLRKLEVVATRMSPEQTKNPGDPELKQATLEAGTSVAVAESPPTPVAGRPGAITSPTGRPTTTSPGPAKPAPPATVAVQARSTAQPGQTVRSEGTKPGTAALAAPRSTARPSQTIASQPGQTAQEPAARLPKLNTQPPTIPGSAPTVTLAKNPAQPTPVTQKAATLKPAQTNRTNQNQARARKIEEATKVSNPLSTTTTAPAATIYLKPVPTADSGAGHERKLGTNTQPKVAPGSSPLMATEPNPTLPPLVPPTH